MTIFFVFFFTLFEILTPLKTDLLALSPSIPQRGEELFRSHCMSCHMEGNNLIIPEKNLKKQTLATNGMNTIEAIMYQVSNGKNGMPAFGGFAGRLTEKEIEKIASYVLEKSEMEN